MSGETKEKKRWIDSVRQPAAEKKRCTTGSDVCVKDSEQWKKFVFTAIYGRRRRMDWRGRRSEWNRYTSKLPL